MDKEFNFNSILDVILKRKLPLAIVAVVAAVLAIIFSSTAFMKPRFQSSASVYPINLDLYSDESETEQMLQLFQNENIKQAVIQKFDLGSRYDYKEGDKNYLDKLNYMYSERVSISPTRYESVDIICEDEDPKVAKEMVEEVIHQFNLSAQKIDQQLHTEYYNMLVDEYNYQKTWLDSLNNEIVKIKNSTGVVDAEGQIERVTEGYMNMLVNNIKGERLEKVERLMTGMKNEGARLSTLELIMEELSTNIGETLGNINMEESKMTRELSFANVVKRPEVTDKKIWPVRWFILLLSVVSSLIIALLFFLIMDRK